MYNNLSFSFISLIYSSLISFTQENLTKHTVQLIPHPLTLCKYRRFRFNWCLLTLSVIETMGTTHDSKSTGLLQSDKLYNYILDTSVFPRESKYLAELRKASETHPWFGMAMSPLAGQMLSFILKLINPKKTIEVGVYTGYSLLLTALALPNDGQIKAIDIHREPFEIGLPFIREAGVEDKIDFIQSTGIEALDNLLQEKENEESFDFAFVDADKLNYLKYHEMLMKLVKVGGVLAYDNTLWCGYVALPQSEVPEEPRPLRAIRGSMIEVNKFLANDSRIEIVQLPLGDGITICRRLV